MMEKNVFEYDDVPSQSCEDFDIDELILLLERQRENNYFQNARPSFDKVIDALYELDEAIHAMG